jgi:hypothetical protein
MADKLYKITGVHEGIVFQWDIHAIPKRIDNDDPCPVCNGTKKENVYKSDPDALGVGGGKDEFLYAVPCQACRGSGKKHNWGQAPDMRKTHPELFEQLFKAIRAEWNRQQNANFELTPYEPKEEPNQSQENE